MRPRVALGLIAVLSLLAGCGAPAADAPAPAAPASCPTTQPADPPFVAPAPYPPTPPSGEGDRFWYGTDELWTWLRADGTWPMAHDEHGLFDKSFWWRQGYDWRTETTPSLRVTGRRLDATAPTVTSSPATNGFEPSMGAFMLLGLELPTGGCWELTGHYHGHSLRFVVRVLRWQP